MVNNKNNKSLHKAKKEKNDEFYTQLSDIEKELGNYKKHFKGKIVFCNCDDPKESNFWKYFYLNFKYLGLKKLVSTHYEEGKPSYKLETSDGKTTTKTRLKQNGDFRSQECVEILKSVDIVVTNPPFSLFREYMTQLVERDKKFIVIGSMNALTYKEIFRFVKENSVWTGYTFPKRFTQPDGSIKQFGNICWFTSLEIEKRNEELILFKKYSGSEEDYPKYDNCGAINIDKVKDIPMDYKGNMGVPITFLNKYNPSQFEIVGQGRQDLCEGMTCMTEAFVSDYYKSGGTGSYKAGNPLLGYYTNDGRAKVPYMRILIKHIK